MELSKLYNTLNIVYNSHRTIISGCFDTLFETNQKIKEINYHVYDIMFYKPEMENEYKKYLKLRKFLDELDLLNNLLI